MLGDTSIGVDVDQLVSKCLTFMRSGGPGGTLQERSPTARRRRHTAGNADSDEEDDVTEHALDWGLFGRHACLPYIRRPPVPSFLLGPLSIEKKQRAHTQRRARLTKDAAGREARPEVLDKEDLSQSDENGLTAICTRIHKDLKRHIKKAEETIEQAGFHSSEELQTERGKSLLKRLRIATNGSVPLFDFVVNPQSFGQTVENIFYVSFLIKEGSVGIQPDDDGLPTLRELLGRVLRPLLTAISAIGAADLTATA